MFNRTNEDRKATALSRQQVIVVFAFMSIIVICLAVRLYYSNQALSLVGPTEIRSDSQHVAVIYQNDLYLFNHQGQTIKTISLTKFNINGEVLDVHLAGEHIWFMDAETKNIQRCQLESRVCVSQTKDLESWLTGFARFYVDVDAIYIIDSAKHRLLKYNRETNQVNVLLDKSELRLPLSITKENDIVWIASTRNNKIVRYDVANNKLLGEQVSITPANTNNQSPIDVLVSSNWQFMLLSDGYLYNGVFIIKHGHSSIAVDIPESKQLQRMTLLNGSILLADSGAFAVWSVNTKFLDVSVFGDELFQTVLRQGLQHQEQSEYYSQLAFIIIIISSSFAIFYGVLVSIKQRKNKKIEKDEILPMPDFSDGQIQWCHTNKKIRNLFYMMTIVLIAIFIGAYVSVKYVSSFNDQAVELFQSIIFEFIIFSLLFSLVIILNISANLFTSIGTDGEYIYIRRFGREHKFLAKDMLFSNFYLVAHRFSFVLRNALGQYFINKIRFRTYVLPVLQQYARSVTNFEIIKYSLRSPSRLNIMNIILMISLFTYTLLLMSSRV